MIFDNITQLETMFMSGAFEILPDQFQIGEETFKQYGSSGSLFEIYNESHPIALFKSEHNTIAFIWENRKMYFTAAGVLCINEAIDPELDVNHKPHIISDECEAVLVGFNDNTPIEAKVDTGAAQCSLHGEDVKWSKDNDQVQFTFNGKRYRMNLAGEQKISSSDGGTGIRPVVTFKVKVHGKLFDGIAFNINDRSNMPHPILIGQNLLEHGNFLIDPSGTKQQNESVSISDEIQIIKEKYLAMQHDMVTE